MLRAWYRFINEFLIPYHERASLHRVKYKEDRILFGTFITLNWPYIYDKHDQLQP